MIIKGKKKNQVGKITKRKYKRKTDKNIYQMEKEK